MARVGLCSCNPSSTRHLHVLGAEREIYTEVLPTLSARTHSNQLHFEEETLVVNATAASHALSRLRSLEGS